MAIITLGYDTYVYFKFRYDKKAIDIVKEYSDGAKYDYKEKYWRVNLATVDDIIEALKKEGYKIYKTQTYKKTFEGNREWIQQ